MSRSEEYYYHCPKCKKWVPATERRCSCGQFLDHLTPVFRPEDGQSLELWERGSGETLACGTGACATLVAAVLEGKAERSATVRLLGGELQIRWDENDGHVYMTGPAVTVFEGDWEEEEGT